MISKLWNIAWVGFFLAACSTTPSATKPASESSNASQNRNGLAENIEGELVATWQRTDQYIYVTQWPGYKAPKGNWGVTKELLRIVKGMKTELPTPYAALYGKDAYMDKAAKQTRSALLTYMENPSDELLHKFMDSPWAKRNIRYYYIKGLEKDCEVKLTSAETEALTDFFKTGGPAPELWVCPGNSDLKELSLL